VWLWKMSGVAINRLRAVLDTNIFLSATLSRNPTSPSKELLERWIKDEFVVITSDVILNELIETLQRKQIEQEGIVALLAQVERFAEIVKVPLEHVHRVIVNDPDDDHIIACAVVGRADYIITYDRHFDLLHGEYQDIQIADALHFLWTLRSRHTS
jgi:putative PIN family toxin of toxin-antitoxin system